MAENDCRVYIDGKYVDPSKFEGPTDEEWGRARVLQKKRARAPGLQAYRAASSPGMISSSSNQSTLRTVKHKCFKVEGLAVK